MAGTSTRPSGGTASAGTNSVNASARASPAVGSGKIKSAPVNSNGYHPATPVPLSAMKSTPLDITTVERRGRLSAAYPPPKKNRPHGLQDAPTYRPTEDEWRDPMEYMRKISPEAKEYGICKIIPPDTWNPDFAIDTEVRWALSPSSLWRCRAEQGSLGSARAGATLLLSRMTPSLTIWYRNSISGRANRS